MAHNHKKLVEPSSLGFAVPEHPVVVVQMTDPNNSASVTSQSSSVASLSSLAQGAVQAPRPNDRTPLLRHTRLFRSLSGGHPESPADDMSGAVHTTARHVLGMFHPGLPLHVQRDPVPTDRLSNRSFRPTRVPG
ncbi:hypothetical protein MRX96_028694 [Rhipicephalus microplus]